MCPFFVCCLSVLVRVFLSFLSVFVCLVCRFCLFFFDGRLAKIKKRLERVKTLIFFGGVGSPPTPKLYGANAPFFKKKKIKKGCCECVFLLDFGDVFVSARNLLREVK